ncbi:MAG: flagellar hook-length control protein FliK [Methylophagaceae bacterium]|jgi:flagellar hook-length control protein FliK
MNHDFLLKNEAPVMPVQGANNKAISNHGNVAEHEGSQVFSSELGKQLDKQTPIKKPAEKTGDAKDVEQADMTDTSKKAASVLGENGKLLPSEEKIVEEFVMQLLSNLDGGAELRQEFTQIMEQFLNTLLNEQELELGLKDKLAGVLSKIINAEIGGESLASSVLASSDKVIELKATMPATISNILGSQNKAPQVETGALINVNNLLDPQTDKAGVKDDSILEQGLGQKKVVVNQISAAIKAAALKPEQSDPIESLLQQIKNIVTKETIGSSEQKSDKVALIAELVKKIVPETPATILKASTPGQDDVSVSKDTLASSQLAQLRPDILQALSKKRLGSDALNLSTSEAPKIMSSKTDIISVGEKKVERIAQLVELLKPAKGDEQLPRLASADRTPPTTVLNSQPATLVAAAKADVPSLDIQPSLQNKAWNRVLSSRVVWMATEGIQQAALKLNPANLGPVEVRLQVKNDQANVTFIAQNSATRDALEQALPRLRESFAENGLDLAGADVSDQASHDAKEDEAQQNNNNKVSQNAEVTMAADGNSTEQTAVSVEKNNKPGVNVYA